MPAKTKHKKVEAPLSELVPTGREFRPTPEFERLEAEVERRKAAGIAEPRAPMRFYRNPTAVKDEVKAEIAKLMERHNITEERLAQAEQETAAAEEEERRSLRQEQRDARWRAICPPKFREPFNFDLVPKEVNRDAVNAVLSWEFQSKGLFIIGDTGLAKTTTMFAMLEREVIQKDRSAIVLDGIAFANQCSVAFGDSMRTERWLRTMLKPDILVIDDLAKRFTPATQQGFFAILDRRTSHLKPVIITTNCTGEMLDAMINDPQLSGPMRRRMRQYCEIVIF